MLSHDVELGGTKRSSARKDVHTPQGPHPDLFHHPASVRLRNSSHQVQTFAFAFAFARWGRIVGGPEVAGVSSGTQIPCCCSSLLNCPRLSGLKDF